MSSRSWPLAKRNIHTTPMTNPYSRFKNMKSLFKIDLSLQLQATDLAVDERRKETKIDMLIITDRITGEALSQPFHSS